MSSVGDIRRKSFAKKLNGLIKDVLMLSKLEASKKLNVDYGWLRKACSIGISQIDSRNVVQLTKIANSFGISIEDLWETKKENIMTECKYFVQILVHHRDVVYMFEKEVPKPPISPFVGLEINICGEYFEVESIYWSPSQSDSEESVTLNLKDKIWNGSGDPMETYASAGWKGVS